MTHKLLLADDSVTIQRVIELTFADEDVEVTAVSDGQTAIEHLNLDPPDIVLADVDMPKRDGYEVAAYVKSRPKLAHIPVVLLTGAFEPVDQARAAAAGSTDVLAKPFEPQMVINRVKELLARKHDGDADVPAPAASKDPVASPSLRPHGARGNGKEVSLDDYFDQLDAAFSTLQPGAPPADASTASEADLGWPVDKPRGSEAPGGPTSGAGASSPMPPAATPAGQRGEANPFASLSAVKTGSTPRTSGAVLSEDIIEEIVSRVLQRLSDKVIRETVAEIVSHTAERLVQEEIERIKNAQ